ncbi:ABC transporter permease [Streptomyces spirodelae]|uniref:FtsX-like permease family protein n=1 Tax=Streptomyces spirodelae TaxID=2812904 RepID=A0ABS3WX25_9ACTN|nr:FtsX-like permease family protein [Streptomyces spirodelae]MBO8187680.1 FtsX-like permease family protein [Streptomyces spirodelae]
MTGDVRKPKAAGPAVLAARLRLFNLRHLRRHPARTALSLGVLTVAAALIVAVLGIYGSVGGSSGRLAGQVAGGADIEVTGRTDEGLTPAAVHRVDELGGVKAAVPLVRSPVEVDGERMLLFGTDRSAKALHSDLSDVAVDAVRDAAEGDGTEPGAVFAGPGVQSGKKGGTVQVASMTGQSHRAPVAGTLSGGTAETVNDGAYLVAPLPVAQRLAGLGDRVQSVLVVAEPGTDTGALRDRLATELGPGAFVTDPSFRADQADDATAMVRNITLLVAFMALVVAAFLIFNSMNMAAAERRGEIASLRALGSRRAPVMRDFLLESLLLALVGAAVGSALGYAMAGASIDSLPPVITDSVDAEVELAVPAGAVPAAVLAAVTASLAASWLAARRASRVPPVEAMRTADPSADTGDGEQRRAGRLWALGLGLALVALAFVTAAVFDDERSFGGGSLLLLGVILLAYALIGPVTRAVALLAARLGPSGRIAASAVERAPRRAWATFMTVLLAVAIGVATTGSSQNTVDAASKNVSTLADTDLMVQRAAEDVLPVRPLLPRETQRELAGTDGVRRVVAGQFTYLNQPGKRALLLGMDGPSNATAYRLASKEARAELLAGRGAVVSGTYAKDKGISKGDTLTLPTAKGKQHIKVADVVDYVSMDAGLIALSLDRVAQWYGQSGASYYEVMLEPGADKAAVRHRIEQQTGHEPYPVHVLDGSESVKATESAVEQVGSLALALQWVIAGVAGLALLNTLMLSVVERRRELGILRALGSSRRYVRRVILTEATAVSVLGGLAGLVVGTALHYLSTDVMGEALAMDIPFKVAPAALGLAIGAIFIALAGSIPPARRAGKLNVVQAIGYE